MFWKRKLLKRQPLTELEQLTAFYGPEILELEFEALERLETEANQLANAAKYAICGELWGKLARDWRHIRFLRFPDKALRNERYQVDKQTVRVNRELLYEKRRLFHEMYGYWPNNDELEQSNWSRVTYNRLTKMHTPVETNDQRWEREVRELASKMGEMGDPIEVAFERLDHTMRDFSETVSNWSHPNDSVVKKLRK